MTRWLDHLMIVPIVLPLVVGAAMLLIDERRRGLKAAINILSILVLGGVAIALLRFADAAPAGAASVGVYRLGNWPAPFGIVLVVDRLSALMLLLTSILALAAVAFSIARWHHAGAYFHALFQFQLMGLNGAFLTGDLFNLFVFFELLLVASYGLALHGSGIARVRAGLHYIAVNLAASLLFLVGVSVIYGIAGTLNMADLAVRLRQVDADHRALLEAGAAILGIAFVAKAGMWPLGFWLPAAYSAAAPPVAAMFAIMTKVGLYVVLRLWLLLFGVGSGASAPFGGEWLVLGGMATIAYGAVGVLASQAMGRLAAFAVLVSSGTVLAAIGFGEPVVTGAALFYLVSSTLGIGAFFLLIELVERGRAPGADVLAVTMEAFGEDGEGELALEREVGIAIPATMAILGASFIGCAVVLAGLPPLSGFVAKFALLTAVLNPSEGGDSPVGPFAWALLALLILSGTMTLVAMVRAGIRAFWAPLEHVVPRVRLVEIAPVAMLLLACATLTVEAGGAMRYMQATAAALHRPQTYLDEVLKAPPREGEGS